MVVSRMTDQIGRVLSGRYRLVAPLGTGASAQVYLADDVRLRRRVAVKVLHAALADDDAFLRRFRAEAQAAAALNHPNILAVYDWGDDEGAAYIVTEHLGGGSLRDMLDGGMRLSPSQALLVGLQASRALDYAHRRGIVHRDVKPANLLFGDDGRLRIADFGLARALAEAAWTEPQGAMLGTARYASPEQAQGQPVDGKADVYSLGLVLIEAVTGAVPFVADTTIATLMARIGKSVEVPAELDSLVRPVSRAGLAEPAERPDAGQLAIGLMAVAADLPRPEPLPLRVAPQRADAGRADSGDPTLLGTEVAGSRLAVPADATLVDAPTVVPGRSPDHLDGEVATDHRERVPRRWPWVIVAALLAVLVGGGAAVGWSAVRVPTHEVPSVLGMSEEDARAALEPYGFDVQSRETRKDGSTPGEVVDTQPAPGVQLDEGAELLLFVSLGNTPAPVPSDLAGRPLEEATAILADAGQFTPEVTEVESEDIPAGVVVELGPDVPAELPKGSSVPLIVSTGPPPRSVPTGLEGKSFEEAAAALEAVQLAPKKVEEFSDDVAPGLVIGLRPGSGTVPRDSEVQVVVSKGPDLVEVPKVKGKTLDEAVGALEAAGFAVGEAFGPANGKPFETDPPAGTVARRGTTVDIFLRR